MKRCLILDSYYPDFINDCRVDPASSYEVELRRILDRQFGTADYYSKNLARYGFECADIIVNHSGLQELWAREHMCHGDILHTQIKEFVPDVIFLQDVSLLSAAELSRLSNDYLLAAQISCPMPPIENVRQLRCVFSSFPHYIPRFTELGIKAVYNPLGFETTLLDRLPKNLDRIYDVTFVGGTGNPSHWKRGMETLHAVAEAIPTFKWWGYGQDLLPPNSALRQKWQGSAFGLDMYRILLQSKICLNRHGEVTEGFANNMRMAESAGCGAMLLTEAASNLMDLFPPGTVVSYDSPADACDKIRHYLECDDERVTIAAAGQSHVLKHHTYAIRMKTVSDNLLKCL